MVGEVARLDGGDENVGFGRNDPALLEKDLTVKTKIPTLVVP